MKDKPFIGIKVVVSSYRKCGNGAKGSGRRNQTGKRGVIFRLENDGSETELVTEEAPNFVELKKKLRSAFRIPTWVAISKSGVTSF